MKKYKARSFIIFSNSCLSKDNNVIVLSVMLYCGGLCGEEVEYVFKKIEGKWTIAYLKRNWVS